MRLSLFIARKVTSADAPTFSRVIIRIAIAAIAVCIAVMIITSALIRGFKHEISNKIFGFWGHIHVTSNEVVRSYETVPIAYNPDFIQAMKSIDQVKYEKERKVFGMKLGGSHFVSSKGGVKSAHTFANLPGVIKTKKDLEGVILKGVDKIYNWDFLKTYIVEGEIITYPEDANSDQIIISLETSRRLSVGTGDRFIIYFVKNGVQTPRRFQVCGIYNTGLKEFDEKIALVDIRQVQDLSGWTENQVGGYEILIDNIDDLDALTEHIYYEYIPDELYPEDIKQKLAGIFQWLELQNKNEGVIIMLMILVSIINLITTLLILILERTSMIGILKALGSRNWAIQKIFLYYAARIILVGLVLGNVLGFLICFLQDKFRFVKLSEADYYLSYAPIKMNYMMILGLNVGTILVTLLFLIIPSFLVTRIHPVKAIRFR